MGYTKHPKKIRSRGAITVEYALVFPIVIVCVYLIVYLGFLCYQQALMQAVVSENVQSRTYLWGYDADKMKTETGIATQEEYISEELYWHIFSDANKKKSVMVQDIEKQLKEKSIIKPVQAIDIDISYHQVLIMQKVRVHVKAVYTAPARRIFQLLGWTGVVALETSCEATLHDPKEFIHNTDYLLQIYEETGAGAWIEEKCRPLVRSLQKVKEYFH